MLQALLLHFSTQIARSDFLIHPLFQTQFPLAAVLNVSSSSINHYVLFLFQSLAVNSLGEPQDNENKARDFAEFSTGWQWA